MFLLMSLQQAMWRGMCETSVFVLVYLYWCICIGVFVLVYLYWCICIGVFVLVYMRCRSYCLWEKSVFVVHGVWFILYVL